MKRKRNRITRLARRNNAGGFSIIDLLAFVAIFSVLVAAGLPHVDMSRGDIGVSLRRVAADLRWTRARAMTAGEHFAFRVTGGSSYQIERMHLVGATWQVDEVVRHVELPAHIAFADFSPDVVEINTRGVVVYADGGTPAPWTPRLVDSKFATERAFTIWPSGQFHALP